MSDVRVTILDINPVSYSVTRSAAFAVQVLGVPGGGGGGGGATSFLGLGDTPSSYSGKGLMAVRVNEAGNALEFFDAATLAQLEGVASAFGELVDAIEALDDTVTAQGGTLTGLSTSLTNHANNLQAHGITTFGASLVSRANASAARTTLGAASAADLTALGGVVEDILSDLGTLGPVAFSGSYDDLIDKPTTVGALAELRCTFDGGGEALEDKAVSTPIERACELTAAALLADVAGDAVVAIKRTREETTITLGTLVLDNGAGVRETDLSEWEATDLASGDVLTAEIEGVATITYLTIVLGRRAV